MKKNKLALLLALIVMGLAGVFSYWHFYKPLSDVDNNRVTNSLVQGGYVTKTVDEFVINKSSQKTKFSSFSITYPTSWKLNFHYDPGDIKRFAEEDLVLTKNENSIRVTRAAIGGHLCRPREEDLERIPIKAQSSLQWLITDNPSSIADLERFFVCQKSGKEEGSLYNDVFYTITDIGRIVVEADTDNVKQIDPELIEILSSIKIH